MDEITLREKVERIRDAGFDVRLMELLLERGSMTRRDRAYVERIWDILKDVERRVTN